MAAKQTKTDDEKLLEALRTVLMAPGLPLQKSGRNPGIFPSGKAGAPTAEIALQRGFLIEVPNESPAKGRKKPAPHYRISAEGQAFVLQQDSPKQALKAINVALQQLARELPSVVNELVQVNGFASVTEEMANHLASIRNSIEQVAERIRQEIASRSSRFNDLVTTVDGFRRVVERALHETGAPGPSSNNEPLAWRNEIESYLLARRTRGTPGDCPIPELYDFLVQTHHRLSIGPFQDALRELHNDDRIRLSGWSGALENIPKPNLAMFVAHKVMYYARLP